MQLELSDADIERIATAVARKFAPPDPGLTVSEAADILRVSTRTIARMCSPARQIRLVAQAS